MWNHSVALALTKCFRFSVLSAMRPPPSGGRLCDLEIGFHASVLGSPPNIPPPSRPSPHALMPLLFQVQPIQCESPAGEVFPGLELFLFSLSLSRVLQLLPRTSGATCGHSFSCFVTVTDSS